MKNKCKILNCEGNHFGLGYCHKHHSQLWKHGKVLNRTRFDPNDFICENNTGYIVLFNSDKYGCMEVAKAIIDVEDIEKCKEYKWCLKGGYVVTHLNGKDICLHNFLLNTTPIHGKVGIDHKNHNALDNRKQNLRIATNQQNQANQGIKTNGSSKYKGVVWDKERGRWRAGITYMGKNIFIGRFRSEKEAAQEYNLIAKEVHGDFANLNSI